MADKVINNYDIIVLQIKSYNTSVDGVHESQELAGNTDINNQKLEEAKKKIRTKQGDASSRSKQANDQNSDNVGTTVVNLSTLL